MKDLNSQGQQLIPIKETAKGNLIVNGRDLYSFLKVQQDYTDWIKKQLEMVEAIENTDFVRRPLKREANNATLIEYVLLLDIAKEVCMIAGVAPRTNEEIRRLSKQARKYFIAVEKAWNDPKMIMKRTLELRLYIDF